MYTCRQAPTLSRFAQNRSSISRMKTIERDRLLHSSWVKPWMNEQHGFLFNSQEHMEKHKGCIEQSIPKQMVLKELLLRRILNLKKQEVFSPVLIILQQKQRIASLQHYPLISEQFPICRPMKPTVMVMEQKQ